MIQNQVGEPRRARCLSVCMKLNNKPSEASE